MIIKEWKLINIKFWKKRRYESWTPEDTRNEKRKGSRRTDKVGYLSKSNKMADTGCLVGVNFKVDFCRNTD